MVDAANIEELVMPLTVMPVKESGETAGQWHAMAWLVGLSGRSANAVAASIVAIHRGEASIDVDGRKRMVDPTFRPTPAVLAILARREEELARMTIRQIDRVLAAPELAPLPASDPAAGKRASAALAALNRREEVRDERPKADGGHARRVAEDLAARRAARQDGGP